MLQYFSQAGSWYARKTSKTLDVFDKLSAEIRSLPANHPDKQSIRLHGERLKRRLAASPIVR